VGRQKANALNLFFEVRVRDNHEIRGIQVQANNAQHAAKRVGGQHIISIRKINPCDVIGDIERMDLRISQGSRKAAPIKDTYSPDWNLTEMFFKGKR
jgi:hypothetical protein